LPVVGGVITLVIGILPLALITPFSPSSSIGLIAGGLLVAIWCFFLAKLNIIRIALPVIPIPLWAAALAMSTVGVYEIATDSNEANAGIAEHAEAEERPIVSTSLFNSDTEPEPVEELAQNESASMPRFGRSAEDEAAMAYIRANPEAARRSNERFEKMRSRFSPDALRNAQQAAEVEANEIDREDKRPAIIIEGYRVTPSAQESVLKQEYLACKLHADNISAAYNRGGVAWDAVQKDLPTPFYIGAASIEPEWSDAGIGVSSYRETFYGDKYAKATYSNAYSMSHDGKCSLQKVPTIKVELDDGAKRHVMKFRGDANARATPGNTLPEWRKYSDYSVKT